MVLSCPCVPSARVKAFPVPVVVRAVVSVVRLTAPAPVSACGVVMNAPLAVSAPVRMVAPLAVRVPVRVVAPVTPSVVVSPLHNVRAA
jgi:hypothetical protein